MNYKSLFHLVLGSAFITLSSCSVSQSNAVDADNSGSQLSIGGSSETYEVLEILTDAYEDKAGIEFEFFPPSQTDGGLTGVKSNAMHLGGVSRTPTADELSDLVYVPIVNSPLVMVVHESVTGVTDLSADQIKAIYSGDVTNWQELGGPDAEIVLFDLAEDENEKQVLRQTYLGAELEISPNAVVFAEDDELLETAATTDFSVAAVAFEDELEDLPITVLTVEGVAPDQATLKSGAYEMVLSLGVVIAQDTDADVQAFIDFVNSEEAIELLDEAGYVVAEG